MPWNIGASQSGGWDIGASQDARALTVLSALAATTADQTQKLPSDEPFDKIGWLAGSTSGAPAFELAWVPFGAYTSVNSPPFTFTGKAHLATTHQEVQGFATCIGGLLGLDTGDTNLRGFAWYDDDITNADVTVQGTFHTLTTATGSSATVAGGFRGCGLFQRITPGTAASFTVNPGVAETVYTERLDFYHFHIETDSTAPDANLTAYVYRVLHPFGGQATIVASHVVPGGVANLKLGSPIRIEFKVETVAGDPTLTCKLLDYYSAPTGSEAVTFFDTTTLGGTVTLGTSIANASGVLTDAHTDKITTNGAAGFAMHRDRQDTVGTTGVDVVEGISAFEIRNASTDAVLMRDEFTRIGITGLASLGTNTAKGAIDIFGNEGVWLNSLWSYGATAATDNTQEDIEPVLEMTGGASAYTANDYALLRQDSTTPSDFTAGVRDYWSMRPSDYDYTHHRSFEFQPPPLGAANTGNIFRMSIMLRGTAKAGVVDASLCAWFDWVMTTGASGTQDFLRFYVGFRLHTGTDEAPALISVAQKEVQASGAGIPVGYDLYDGSWHKFEYDVHTFPEGTSPNAPVVHEIKWNGATIILDEPGTISSAQTLADGRVLDTTGLIVPGSVEGFEFYANENETDGSSGVRWTPPKLRAWTQEALTTKTEGVDPNDMAAATWPDEGTASGVLDTVFQPDYSMPEARRWGAYKHPFESGHAATRASESQSRRRWSLSRSGATTAEKDALLAFFETHGIETPFTWTPPNASASIKGRFAPDTLIVEEFAKGAWAIQFSVEEVF